MILIFSRHTFGRMLTNDDKWQTKSELKMKWEKDSKQTLNCPSLLRCRCWPLYSILGIVEHSKRCYTICYQHSSERIALWKTTMFQRTTWLAVRSHLSSTYTLVQNVEQPRMTGKKYLFSAFYIYFLYAVRNTTVLSHNASFINSVCWQWKVNECRPRSLVCVLSLVNLGRMLAILDFNVWLQKVWLSFRNILPLFMRNI